MSLDDRRKTDRHSLPLEMEFWVDSTRHRGRIEDLGEGGAYVYTGLQWPSGKTIEFSFVLPGSSEPIRGSGTVVWTEYMGFGLRFDTLDEETRQRIRDAVGDPVDSDRRGSGFDQRLRAACGGQSS